MVNQDLITWPLFLKKGLQLIPRVPQILEGIRLTRLDNPSQPVGLGLEFEAAALDNPKGVALLYENMRYTYGELNSKANQLAHHLRSSGVTKGDVVGILIENRPELLISVLAVAKLGAICAMLNTKQTKKNLATSIQLVAPTTFLVGQELINHLLDLPTPIIPAPVLIVIDDPETETSVGDTLAIIDQQSDYASQNFLEAILDQPTQDLDTSKKIYLHDPCFYIYTSGTSGLPKAGVLTHGRWMRIYGGVGKLAINLQQDDVLYATMPLFHATALCVCWSGVIAARAGFAISRRFSASQFWHDCIRYHATAIGYVGDLCRFLLVQPPREIDNKHQVKTMLGNGLRPAIWEKFKNRFGIQYVYEFYGASDGNVGFFNLMNFNNTVGFSPNRYELVAIDQDTELPIRNDAGWFVRVKKGDIGLLISEISTHFPLDGYTDKSETEKRILKNAFETGDRWLNTGDLMRDLGFWHTQFIDRVGDSYRWLGENVSSQQIENTILEYPSVRQAVVYGVKVPHHEGRAGMATLQLMRGTSLRSDERRQFAYFLQANMPNYAIPRFIRVTSRIDRTETFKLKKRKLQREAYDLDIVADALYVFNPKRQTYDVFKKSHLEALDQGSLRC